MLSVIRTSCPTPNTSHFSHFAYLTFLTLSTQVKELLARLACDHPFHALYPLHALKNGALLSYVSMFVRIWTFVVLFCRCCCCCCMLATF